MDSLKRVFNLAIKQEVKAASTTSLTRATTKSGILATAEIPSISLSLDHPFFETVTVGVEEYTMSPPVDNKRDYDQDQIPH